MCESEIEHPTGGLAPSVRHLNELSHNHRMVSIFGGADKLRGTPTVPRGQREVTSSAISYIKILTTMILGIAMPNAGAQPSSLTNSSSIVASSSDGSPNVVEIANGWRIISADQVLDSDESALQQNIDVTDLYPAHHLPQKVSQVLEAE